MKKEAELINVKCPSCVTPIVTTYTGKLLKDELISTKVLPQILSDTYGVSKPAAYVRLKKLGFIVDKKLVDEKKKQFKLF